MTNVETAKALAAEISRFLAQGGHTAAYFSRPAGWGNDGCFLAGLRLGRPGEIPFWTVLRAAAADEETAAGRLLEKAGSAPEWILDLQSSGAALRFPGASSAEEFRLKAALREPVRRSGAARQALGETQSLRARHG